MKVKNMSNKSEAKERNKVVNSISFFLAIKNSNKK
jgi:hypothetical protein